MAEEQKRGAMGDALVKQEMITREELDRARERERETGTPWYRQLLQMKKVAFSVLGDLERLNIEFHPKSVREEHGALGRTLVEMKAITQTQLDEALAEQKRNGRLLGNILLDRGLVTRRSISIALARQHGMEYAEAAVTPSTPQAMAMIPENLARSYKVIPVRVDGDRLSVLVSHPQDRERLGDLGVLLGKRIHGLLTDVDDIRAEIAARYQDGGKGKGLGFSLSRLRERETPPPPEKPATKSTKREPATPALEPVVAKSKKREADAAKGKTMAKETVKESRDAKNEKAMANGERKRFEEIAKQAAGVPVMRLVETILEGAVNSGATDIHLDPQDPEMRVRYRIDGVLHDVMSISPDIESAAVSRIKIMADLDITETRRPQDGHISMVIGDAEYDVRVASLPTFLGERVVLRLLDQSSVLAGIKDLGLEKDDEDKLLRLIKQPYGMVLVTGPTGSGKTTTLYAALNHKNVLTDSIVTLEDPVEYQLSGINQVQIDTDIGVTFASTLRAALRQDIDVLLVGEIRDAETAQIGVRAAMTGHLVFSTLHTNDAGEAISTLRNMGVPSYLIGSALTAVVGQRLVRKICEKCRTPFAPSKGLLKEIGLPESTKKLYHGKGCEACYHTGSKGRTGIFEILEITPEVRKQIVAEVEIEKIITGTKMKTMADRCRQKVKDGIVAPEEFLRVVRI